MINLSKHKFTVYEFKILGYNFNFIPTPRQLNKEQVMEDVNQFARKIKLKTHFGNQTRPIDETTIFKAASNKEWTPRVHHTVETFIEAFKKDIKTELEATNHNKRPRNLSKPEEEALTNLKKRTDIILINADKGGALTILNLEDYINEANRQLSDTTLYQELIYDPTVAHANTINDTIKHFEIKQMIPKSIANGLITRHPKTPQLKLPPKVHKTGHPGRPVVSSVNSHSAKISKYVDFHLAPEIPKIRSYIKDSNDFMKQLDELPANKTANSYLVTLDVKSLYSNIPHAEGIEVIKDTLQKARSKVTNIVLAFLWLILTLNNFTFNGKHYLQLLGVAMGTICSAHYANLFMGNFEEKWIYQLLDNNTKFYKRFIDDIFLVWNGTLDELKIFINKINDLHSTIKFEAKYSFDKIEFLDTEVYKNNEGKLCTTLYKKPTDRQAYLHNKSYHPTSTKKSIVYSQSLRIRRICTEDSEYMKHALNLVQSLKKRGYKEEHCLSIIKDVEKFDRKELLKPKMKHMDNKSTMAITYHKNLPNIKSAWNNNKNILTINETISQIFNDSPRIAYKRNPNLHQILNSHKIINNKLVKKQHIIGKCRPCLTRTDNLCCKQMIATSEFTNRKTGRIFKILHNLNCKSSHVIYLIECILCNHKGYIGKSEPPSNLRTNGHRSDSNPINFNSKTLPVDKHFGENGHNFLKHARIILIEQIKDKTKTKEEMRSILEKREDFWMKALNTLQPDGFNQSLNHPNI